MTTIEAFSAKCGAFNLARMTERTGRKEKADRPVKPKRLNCKKAAELAGVSEGKIRRAVSRGTLRSFKIEGSRFILYRELVRWLHYDPLDSE
jgi:excisionase family DNA binding protein